MMKSKVTYSHLLILILFLFAFYSSKGQIVWSDSQEIASSSFGKNFPRITMDGNGKPMVAWSSSTNFFFSKWSGNGFGTPQKLNPDTVSVAGSWWMGPDIASKGDTIFAVYKQTPETDTSSHIFCVSSFDGGETFNNPVRVDYIGDNFSRFVTITIDDEGNPLVAFMRIDSDFHNHRWVVAKSIDQGTSFLPDAVASGWSDSEAEACDCCPSKLVASDNFVALPYRDNNANIRDTWAGISTNGGNSFENGINIDQQNWYIDFCPSSGPDAVIADDTLYTIFMNGASGNNLVYYNKSSLSNGVNSPAIPVNQTSAQLTMQNYPRLDHHQNAMAFVWKQFANSQFQIALQYDNDITDGIGNNLEIVEITNQNGLDVALYNDTIWVIWAGSGSSGLQFKKGVYQEGLQISENSVSKYQLYPNPTKSNFIIQGKNMREISGIEITNMSGQMIKQIEVDKSSKLTVSMEDLKKGIYFIRIFHEEKISNLKVVKN